MATLTFAQASAKFEIFISEMSIAVQATANKIRKGRKLTESMERLRGMSLKLSDDSLEKLMELLTTGYDVKDMVRLLGNPNLEQAFTRINALGYLRNGNPLNHDQLVQMLHRFKGAANAETTFKRLKANNDNVVGFVYEVIFADHIGADDLSLVLHQPTDHTIDADVVKGAILYQLKFYESTVVNSGNVGDWIKAAWFHSGQDLSKVKIVVAKLDAVNKSSIAKYLIAERLVSKETSVEEAISIVEGMLSKYP